MTDLKLLVVRYGSDLGVMLCAVLLAFVGGWVALRHSELDDGPARPQHPRGAGPYREVEVRLPAAEVTEVVLAGALTVPKGEGPVPGVVLVSGAGPQDRDGELAGHQRYLVLADALTRAGIAVLRLDDRGVGGSGGSQLEAKFDDLASDARRAVAFLRRRPEVDEARVGIVGASQGSVVAALAAVGHPEVAFLVLVSGPALPGREVLVEQREALARAQGLPEEEVAEISRLVGSAVEVATGTLADEEKRRRLRPLTRRLQALAAGPASALASVAGGPTVESQIDLLLSPQMQDLLLHDPRTDLRRLKVPVLALYGSLDLQVLPEVHRLEMQAALEEAPTTEVEVRELPGLNHLLQPALTGLPDEYGKIETTLAPEVLEIVAAWVLERGLTSGVSP